MTLTGRKGTIVIVALVASVCVNLLLAGMMVGQRWHGGPGRMGGMFGGPMRDMPEAARPLVKEVFDANRAEFDAKRAAVDEARQRIAAALQADTIDQAQLDAALGEMELRMRDLYQHGQKVMVEVAQKLPPELRKDWAKKWAEERRWKKP